jgi:lysophospholipase L1-like esterase
VGGGLTDAPALRLRSVLSRLVLLLIGVTVSLSALEGTARLIPLWPDQLSDVDPMLGWSHIPKARGWWINIAAPLEFRSYVQINSQGLHDREILVPKPAGVTRTLLLGDSITDGLEVPLDQTFAKQLEHRWREAGKAVEVINGGQYGYGTDQELLFYRVHGKAFRPDVVVLCFTPGNDIDDNLERVSIAPKPYFTLAANGTLQLMSPPPPATTEGTSSWKRLKQVLYEHSKLYRFTGYEIKRCLPSLYAWLESLGIMSKSALPTSVLLNEDALTAGPYDAAASEYYEAGWKLTQALVLELKKEVEASGAELVVALMPDPRQFVATGSGAAQNVAKWNVRFMQLCADSGLRCLDLYPIFRDAVGRDKSNALFYPHDGHPNAEGHRQISDALYRFLTPYVP